MWPQFDEKMISSVSAILQSGKVNQWTNPIVSEFENAFAQYIDCRYAVAVFNGTVALDLCLKTLDLQPDDEVIVTPRTFVASASCIVWNGMKPVFADVDVDSQNITLESIKRAVSKKTRAVILVHLAGWPCELEEICAYCRYNNIYVIEDCAQAHGAYYNGRSVGTWGDINAWSFCQDKIITTGGEGGMITTNNEDLYKKAWSLKDHGKRFNASRNDQLIHDVVGTNWRMIPIQACIGIHALSELKDWVEHRRMIANIYNENLRDIARTTIPSNNIYHSYYKYYFFLETDRDKILSQIIYAGVFAQVGSCGEVYKEKQMTPYRPSQDLPNAKRLYETSILLRCDPTISKEDAYRDIQIIRKIILKQKRITTY
jgi:dTDP-4-amino-4,6-dideoxygalactose transaminase